MASGDDRKEYREGPDAAQRFDDTMRRILSVPKDELTKREAAYQKSRADKPRPGPRRKK
jgi:hypothetical protein